MAEKTNGGGVAPAPTVKTKTGGSGGGAAAVVRSSVGGGGGGSGGAESTTSGDAFGHHEIRDIARGRGQSAIKSGAYITGESMRDERIGLTFGRLEAAGRVLASGTVGPKGSAWSASELWSGAEKAETKSNARTAQMRDLALPNELDETAHKRLLNGYALWLRDEYGLASTWALHAPSPHGDQRNTHGHIQSTTRAVEMDAEGRPLFGAKVRALSGNRQQVAAEFERQRQEWAKRVNGELERAGSPRRLDHRSHARRAEAGEGPAGLKPSAHKGPKRAQRERKNPEAMKAARAAEAARRAHNAARTAAWRAGAGVLKDALRGAGALTKGPDERETLAAARWAAKQAREHEAWKRKQERDEDERGGKGHSR